MNLVLAALVPGNRAVCQVAMHTGLRVGDIVAIPRSKLSRCFWVTEQKTGKRKQVGLPDWLLDDIREQAGDSPWAFPGRDPAKHRTRQAVWKDLKRVQRAFRLPINVGTHSMRKEYAVELMRKYGELDRVKKALNHNSTTVTVIYAMADALTQSAAKRRSVSPRKR